MAHIIGGACNEQQYESSNPMFRGTTSNCSRVFYSYQVLEAFPRSVVPALCAQSGEPQEEVSHSFSATTGLDFHLDILFGVILEI